MNHPQDKLGSVEQLLDRFGKAVTRRAQWENMWRDAYDYTMPAKNLWTEQTKGNYRRRQIFDSTAVKSVPRFASRIMAALTPAWSQWASLSLGPEIEPDSQPELDPEQWPDYQGLNAEEVIEKVVEAFFHHLHHSNFSAQAFEAYQDLSVSCASVFMDWRGDGFVFQAVPLSELFLEEGPNGSVQTQWRQLKVPVRNIQQVWPGSDLDAELQRKVVEAPDTEIEIVEGIVFVPPKMPGDEGLYHLVVIAKERKHMLLWSLHGESSPAITAPWSRAPGEIYGRGPVITALADIMTANKMVEFKLKADAFATLGLWTGVDDGVWNPHNIRITPGTVLSVGSNDSANPSLRPLDLGGAPQIIEVDLQQMRRNIEEIMFANPLGDLQETPVRTLGENMMRMQEMLEQAGATFSLLEREWAAAIVTRGIFLLAREGKVPPLRVDGREASVNFTSPLAQARDAQELQGVIQFAQAMSVTAPNEAPFMFEPEETANYVREKTGIPSRLIRSGEQIQEVVAQFAAMQGAQGGEQ